MRSLHVCSGDLWAGAEVSVFHLLTALARREAGSVAALVLNPGALASRLQQEGVPVVVAAEGRTSFASLVKIGGQTASQFRSEVIHSHRYKEHVLGAVLSASSRLPHVRSAHGLSPALEWSGRLRGLGSVLEGALADWTGSTWIAVSDDLATRIAGIRRTVHVVPNGLPSTVPDPRRDVLEAQFNDGAPAWFLGFVGRLEAVKRPDLFVEMIARFPEHAAGRAVRGVILGDGSLRAGLQAQSARLACAARIRFLGHRADAETLLPALDVLVIPSDHEGLPMVLLEAMRAGVAVVATEVGGIPGALNGSGWLAPPGDGRALGRAVGAVLDDPAARMARPAAARERFRTSFAVGRTVDRVLEVYGSL